MTEEERIFAFISHHVNPVIGWLRIAQRDDNQIKVREILDDGGRMDQAFRKAAVEIASGKEWK